MHMRRACLILPFVVPFFFHRLYQPINEAWTVKRFGCGCPPVRGAGGIEAWRFNANDFNLILWLVIAAVCSTLWWLLIRREFTSHRSTWYFTLQGIGIFAVLSICMNRWASEGWL